MNADFFFPTAKAAFNEISKFEPMRPQLHLVLLALERPLVAKALSETAGVLPDLEDIGGHNLGAPEDHDLSRLQPGQS